MTAMEIITLTTKTLVERKLVMETVIGSAMIYLLILLFMSLVFWVDLETKWYYDTRAGRFDRVPNMREEAKKQEQLEKVAALTPAMYSGLYRHWQYLIIGIPLLTLLVGGILAQYRSVTIAILGLYHCFFSTLTLCLVMLTIFAIMISNMPYIIRDL